MPVLDQQESSVDRCLGQTKNNILDFGYKGLDIFMDYDRSIKTYLLLICNLCVTVIADPDLILVPQGRQGGLVHAALTAHCPATFPTVMLQIHKHSDYASVMWTPESTVTGRHETTVMWTPETIAM